MTSILTGIRDNLQTIKSNLVKLTKERRTRETLDKKLDLANNYVQEFNKTLDQIRIQVKDGKIDSESVEQINILVKEINELYSRIKEFCSEEQNIELDPGETQPESTMAKFDLKTAVSLIPEMTGDESITKKLIDAIELYSSMLDDEGKKTLIQFVLKTRLTSNAKLRLSSNYDSVAALISDIKAHLLTQHSSTALHIELTHLTQSSATIEEYGRKIEDLLVNLTISQTDGNENTSKVLQPINEKLAIRRFIDGLRNRSLRIILAARNYTTLKDVIRAAKEEELSTSVTQQQEGSVYFSNRGRGQRYFRGNSFRGGQQRQLTNRNTFTRGSTNTSFRGSSRSRVVSNRGSGYRGRGNFQNNRRGNKNSHYVHFAGESSDRQNTRHSDVMNSENGNGLEFFRA